MNKTCSECSGEIIEGFILDMTEGGQLVSRWVKGSPEISFWIGVKYKNKECRTVETYRCTNCSLLKSYARIKVDPPM